MYVRASACGGPRLLTSSLTDQLRQSLSLNRVPHSYLAVKWVVGTAALALTAGQCVASETQLSQNALLE